MQADQNRHQASKLIGEDDEGLFTDAPFFGKAGEQHESETLTLGFTCISLLSSFYQYSLTMLVPSAIGCLSVRSTHVPST